MNLVPDSIEMFFSFVLLLLQFIFSGECNRSENSTQRSFEFMRNQRKKLRFQIAQFLFLLEGMLHFVFCNFPPADFLFQLQVSLLKFSNAFFQLAGASLYFFLQTAD